MKCIHMIALLCIVVVLRGTLCRLLPKNCGECGADPFENSGGKICEASAADTTEVSASLFPANCGQYTPNNTLNGEPGEVYEYPWMAILEYRGLYAPWSWCVGTLISKRYILTAAYCTQEYQPISVRVGGLSVNHPPSCTVRPCRDPLREYEVECATSHQDFHDLHRENNIGLVRTKQEVEFQANVQPICLPLTPDLRKKVLPHYIAICWYNMNTFEPGLWKSLVTPSDREECEKELYYMSPPKSNDSELCILAKDYEARYPATMKYGGPLGNTVQYDGGQRFVQFAISSFPKGNSYPSIYTNVSSYLEWIVANMKP